MEAKMKNFKINIWNKLMLFGNICGCHQRADRSFFFKCYQFPVCARCTGVIIGYLTAIGVYLYKSFDFWVYIVLCAVMFIDWYIQYLKIKASTNIRRLITGILGGFGIMSLEIGVLRFIILYLKVHL